MSLILCRLRRAWTPMSLPEENVDQAASPCLSEPDLTVSVYLTPSSPHPLRFIACESAARRFADHWQRYGQCAAVEFTDPEENCARLPCERLWLVP